MYWSQKTEIRNVFFSTRAFYRTELLEKIALYGLGGGIHQSQLNGRISSTSGENDDDDDDNDSNASTVKNVVLVKKTELVSLVSVL